MSDRTVLGLAGAVLASGVVWATIGPFGPLQDDFDPGLEGSAPRIEVRSLATSPMLVADDAKTSARTPWPVFETRRKAARLREVTGEGRLEVSLFSPCGLPIKQWRGWLETPGGLRTTLSSNRARALPTGRFSLTIVPRNERFVAAVRTTVEVPAAGTC